MFFSNHGVLGINARNLLYIRPYNKKKAIKLADNKLKTKHFLSARGIPVPRLFGVIRSKEEAEKFDFNSLPGNFVLKPTYGFGGEGIIPISEKKNNKWFHPNGTPFTKDDLTNHIFDIIDGRYSLSNIRDTAFFEQRIISDESLGHFSYKGLPDIRVVVHNLIPVMAMLRLPTKESNGKANLHQGAIGVGIDIAKGETTYSSYKNKIIDEVPDKGSIRGLKIPHWEEILFIASKTQLITNLGYMAVDVALDKSIGPTILEINARAGLGVQIANLAPLRKRLERIQGIKVSTPTKGVRIAKDMFGNTIEKEITQVTGKKVVGIEETAEIIVKNHGYKVAARIDTNCERSSIDYETAKEIGLLTEKEAEEQETVKVKFTLAGARIQTILDLTHKTHKNFVLKVGSRDLGNFIIDPTKSKSTTLPSDIRPGERKEYTPTKLTPHKKQNNLEKNNKLIEVDSKIKLLYHLKPTNLEEEKTKFLEGKIQNPQFEYPELKFEPFELYEELEKIEFDSTSLGKLLSAKKDEIEKKIALLEQRGNPMFTKISIDLFGKPTEEEAQHALSYLNSHPEEIEEPDTIDAEEAEIIFNKVFEDYGLNKWKVKLKESMVADCVAGKNNRLFVRAGARFSKTRIKNLIIHEIETHILRAENGKNQPYELFQRGLANYLLSEEGLATYNVKTQGTLNMRRTMLTFASVHLAQTRSFRETFEALKKYNLSDNRAFSLTLKTKRGLENTTLQGGFTKGYVYYKGYKQVEEFIKQGGKMKDLYIGKYNINDLPLIKKIAHLNPPKILPTWLTQ